jgi:hypothetical protein
MMTTRALAIAFFLSAGSVCAQEMPRAKCDAPAPLPAALSGWTEKTPLTAATAEDGLKSAALTPGKSAVLTLHPTREVHYPSQPEKPGGSVAHGGLASFRIAKAGTYQVSLNSGAWIDVVKDGAMVESSAHGPGPACTGIGKTVRFALQPANYVLQISANAGAEIAVMISPVP